ncbi:hypothetical protein HDU87_007450 [Geranomyces variabilis]|uniref:Disintegrin and metalloproteinase domain-containing protein B n=1 Tax=Geranomyces variabilis TaxID=109894 RepID=A0AAD5TUA8_9FUNG|nr:hypothetical protein HDU87_007450 [Geranomyces variabilis]
MTSIPCRSRLLLVLPAVLLALLLLLSSVGHVAAHSQALPPVRFYDFVDNIDIKRPQLLPMQLSFRAMNQSFTLQLEQNQHLLHPHAVVKRDSETDETDEYADLHRIAANMYKGHVVQADALSGDKLEKVGWARMFYDPTRNVFEGTFTARNKMYDVKDIDVYHKTRRSIDIQVLPASSRSERHRLSRMIVLADRDHAESMVAMPDPFLMRRSETAAQSQCGFDPVVNSQRGYVDQVERNVASLAKRAPAGCPTSRKVLFMAAAADCTYTRLHGGKEATLTQMLLNWNQASQVYETSFNVSLGLVQVLVQDTCTPTDDLLKWNRECDPAYTINQRLSDFSEWRGKKTADQAGLWHLMTNCPTGASVGVAWLKTLCNVESTTQPSAAGQQFVSGCGVSAATNVEWTVVAHEIGHNFGAIHDCSGLAGQCPCTDPDVCQCCPCSDPTTQCDCNGRYIMHPTDSSTLEQFSPCSITSICGAYPKFGTCLQEPGALNLVTASICGNGIREGNEQCDCGSAAECAADPCCTTGCVLRPTAKCSDKNDQCCGSCQIKANGTVCRTSSGVCDLAEQCDGTSPTCPLDVFVPDKTTCTGPDGAGKCATGQCTSRDIQCKNQATLSLSGACSDQESQCQLRCNSNTQGGVCVSLDSYFVDGTPCGFSGSGVCAKGTCQSGNIVDQALGWISTHLNIAIPILILAGFLLLSILYSILRCLCCGGGGISRSRPAKMAVVPPPQQQRWVDPAAYNGPSAYGPPPPMGGGPPYAGSAARAAEPPNREKSWQHAPRSASRPSR